MISTLSFLPKALAYSWIVAPVCLPIDSLFSKSPPSGSQFTCNLILSHPGFLSCLSQQNPDFEIGIPKLETFSEPRVEALTFLNVYFKIAH